MLREVNRSTDGAGNDIRLMFDMHKCVHSPRGELRYAGPAYFLHFLSWTDFHYAEILRHARCSLFQAGTFPRLSKM